MPRPKTMVVIPAYNTEGGLEKTISAIPLEAVDEILVLDDGSKDRTSEIAGRIKAGFESAGKIIFTIKTLPKNTGYGGAQKQCYSFALERGAEIVVMLHSDFQYDPGAIPQLVAEISAGHVDVMLGTRIRSMKESLDGGMPAYKYFANRFLTIIQNTVTGRSLPEWHTGLRAYSRKVLLTIKFNSFSDDFLFDSQALFAIVECGFRIGHVPVPVRYDDDSSSISFSRSVRYGLGTLVETAKFAGRGMRKLGRTK